MIIIGFFFKFSFIGDTNKYLQVESHDLLGLLYNASNIWGEKRLEGIDEKTMQNVDNY